MIHIFIEMKSCDINQYTIKINFNDSQCKTCFTTWNELILNHYVFWVIYVFLNICNIRLQKQKWLMIKKPKCCNATRQNIYAWTKSIIQLMFCGSELHEKKSLHSWAHVCGESGNRLIYDNVGAFRLGPWPSQRYDSRIFLTLR